MVHGFDERQRVDGSGERDTGVVDRVVQILEAERHAVAFTQLGEPGQRAPRGEPHGTRDLVNRFHRKTALTETRSVQIEPGALEPVRHSARP